MHFIAALSIMMSSTILGMGVVDKEDLPSELLLVHHFGLIDHFKRFGWPDLLSAHQVVEFI